MESRSWGEEFTFHLVRYDGRYYAWSVRPFDDGDHAYEMPSQDAARRFLDSEFAFLLTFTDWGERVASATPVTKPPGGCCFPPTCWTARGRDLAGHLGSEARRAVRAGRVRRPRRGRRSVRRPHRAGRRMIERLDIGWPGSPRVPALRAALARAGAARAGRGHDPPQQSTDTGRAGGQPGRGHGERVPGLPLPHPGRGRLDLEGADAGQEGRAAAAAARAPGPRHPGTAAATAAWSAGARFAIEAGERAGSQSDRGRRPGSDGCRRADRHPTGSTPRACGR